MFNIMKKFISINDLEVIQLTETFYINEKKIYEHNMRKKREP